ncbi:hypothetical protein JV46_19660 [Solemya velum gill symbiont]|uniref:Uncharacterized protein n=1 Tax=Solemya velum gill symbiont TaxID=2340 RepID=A0A0B0HAZ7_SOVGS|nr:hypothetical protein JV46_19660 [Solemya velum gill symbiont]
MNTPDVAGLIYPAFRCFKTDMGVFYVEMESETSLK